MRSGQRGGQREEHPATSFLKKKQYDFSPQFGPVESSYLFTCVVYWVKTFFRYIGITNCVYVLNKSRGSEMHWVGGRLIKVHKGTIPSMLCLNLSV